MHAFWHRRRTTGSRQRSRRHIRRARDCFKYKIIAFQSIAVLLASAGPTDRRFGVPDLAPMKTKDGRFGYEAAGDPGAPPLVFLHGIGGAARAWRGQLDYFADSYRAIAWDMPGYGGSAPLADRQHRQPCRRAGGFPARKPARSEPVIVGHSIGGMIVQQLLAKNPHIASAVVLAQTSPAFGKPDGDWQKAIHRCAARPARSRRNAGHAGAVAGEGIGRRRS